MKPQINNYYVCNGYLVKILNISPNGYHFENVKTGQQQYCYTWNLFKPLTNEEKLRLL